MNAFIIAGALMLAIPATIWGVCIFKNEANLTWLETAIVLLPFLWCLTAIGLISYGLQLIKGT